MDATHERAAQEPPTSAGTVIIGGGQAGLQVADSLRAGGYTAPVTIIADEAGAPYQRPPLSKDFLLPGKEAAPLPLRGPAFLADHDITLRAGTPATAIDRTARIVALADGTAVPYEHLVLATGARNRNLGCPGAALPGIHGLKTLHDAEALHLALPGARDVVVIGAGFIGLEFAAAARAHGARVTVLEFAPRPMGRALTPLMGDWFAASHGAQGVDLRLGEGIDSFTAGDDGRVAAAVSTAGTSYPADLVVVGIGVVPNDGLATEAGLDTDNGVLVDGALRTADPAILAVGDCASFPNVHARARTRLESVQNATDQARHAAATILGAVEDYAELPWFWSTQGAVRLQIAGLSAPGDEATVVGDPESGKFSVLCHREGRLVAVESVNSPADHIAARKLIVAGVGPDPQTATAPGFSLKGHAREVLRVPAPA